MQIEISQTQQFKDAPLDFICVCVCGGGGKRLFLKKNSLFAGEKNIKK